MTRKRIRQLADDLRGALAQIRVLDRLRPTCVICLDATADRQTVRGPACTDCVGDPPDDGPDPDRPETGPSPRRRPAPRPRRRSRPGREADDEVAAVTAPVPLVIALLGLIVSARARLNAVILGQPVSVPMLWLVAAAIVLVLAALVLWILRGIIRDGGCCCGRGRRERDEH